MSAATTIIETRTLADLLRDLGGISAERVRLRPAPGFAAENDVIANSRCELIDGALVEKSMGLKESLLASFLIEILGAFVRRNKLGKVTAPDGTFRLMPGLIRIPDVAFVSWAKFPGRRIPNEPAPDLAPDLAIEVLSEGNTDAEMTRKIGEYFRSGVRSVWIVDRFQWTVTVYRSEHESRRLSDDERIEEPDLLPGFELAVSDLFDEIRDGVS